MRERKMPTRKQYRSRLLASIHETAEGLHAAGAMDKQTLREFDVFHGHVTHSFGGRLRVASEHSRVSARRLAAPLSSRTAGMVGPKSRVNRFTAAIVS